MSERSVVKIDDWPPLESAVLVGSGVPTGWGTPTSAGALRAGRVRLRGRRHRRSTPFRAPPPRARSTAKYVVVDPVEFTRETALKLDATHAFSALDESAEKVHELTRGRRRPGAGHGRVVEEKVVQDAFDVVGKGGVVVVTGLGGLEEPTVHVSDALLTKWEKTIKGSMFGMLNPRYDIMKLLRR